jgi:hypothetical protein
MMAKSGSCDLKKAAKICAAEVGIYWLDFEKQTL